MKSWLGRRLRQSPRLKSTLLFARGALFVGARYRCPCCDWRLRGFVGRWGILAANNDGYCPRCNAKARHRRLWLYLEDRTNLFADPVRLLEVGPWWSLARRFRALANVDFVGLDPVRAGPQVTVIGDVTDIPADPESFDAALCIHVLEHVDDDRRAIAELFRILKPGGWAIVSVPIRLDQRTHEDPTITDPAQRAEIFGERGHVRFYGIDLTERLTQAGFDVRLDNANDIPADVRSRFGLRNDEHLFHCTRPAGSTRH